MIKLNPLFLCKTLFALLLVITTILGFQISDHISIDTNLSELNPQNQNSGKTKAAIEELSQNIERRVLLLVSGSDEDLVFAASDTLRAELKSITGLQIHPDSESTANELLEILRPYRFALLTEQQRYALSNSDSAEIVETAKEEMFALSSIRFYPFNQDPLGWHSAYIQNIFASLQPPSNQSRGFNSVVSFSIGNGAMDMQRQQHLSDALKAIGNQLVDDYDVKLDSSGIFFFAADAAASSKQDISMISTGSTIGVVLLLLLAFRSLWSLLLPVASVVLGVTFAFVSTHSIYGNVHVLTIVFGASLIGIVIDYSLHYFYHVGANKISQQPADNKALHRALFLSLLTSVIGYSSLGFSDLQALQKVAVFSCCGLVMAWLSVICIGEFGTRKEFKLDQQVLPRLEYLLSQSVAKLSKKIWFIVSIITIGLATFISLFTNVFSDDPRLFFKASESLLQSERAVAEVANDYEPGRYILIQGASEAEIYFNTEQLMSSLRQYPDFNSNNLTSLLKWVPSLTQQQRDYQLQQKIYQTNGIAQNIIQQLGGNSNLSDALQSEYRRANNTFIHPQEVARLLSSSAPPLWVVNDNIITSFILIQKGTNTDIVSQVADKLEGVEFVNTLQRTSDSLKQQRHSASKLLLFAYLLVALLLSIRYRSIKTASMLLVPLCASASVLLVCVMFGLTFNLFHVMALFLILGFGMDYTIFTREIGDMRSITLQAILLSAITSLLSFGLLSISSIPVAHSFGITLLIGNCFNLLGVFVYSHCISSNQ